MELTREALAQVKFRTRGQWYDALQVDQFIEELMAAADRQEEESRLLREEWMARLAQATEEAQGLRERLRALERESRAARSPAQGETQPLEEERDQLIADIKALRRFRESFREAVRRDAQALLEPGGRPGLGKHAVTPFFISCREARESHGD